VTRDVRKAIGRLTREERETSFLDTEPPVWCIESEKWPYDTADWRPPGGEECSRARCAHGIEILMA